MSKKPQTVTDLTPTDDKTPALESETTPKEEPKPVTDERRDGKLWKACSWLTSKGREVASPGETVFLSKALSDHYLRTAPGSIEPADELE